MSNNDSKTYIVNDQPTEKDALDFTPYVETLADIIQTGNTPLTIGVFGTWGSGKTSLMKMIKNGIPQSEYRGLPSHYTVVWFDAWKYDKEETLWRVLLLSVLARVKETARSKNEPLDALEYLETMLYRAVDLEKVGGVKIDLLNLGGWLAKGTVQLGLSFIPGGAALGKLVEDVQKSGTKALTDDFTQAIQRERTKIHIEQIRFLEQFQDKFKELIKQYIEPDRLVVFVDDLDRCLPEKGIEVLEAIKLFLDAENCVFILGLDQEVIARGIEMKYKELGAKQDSDSQQRFTVEGVSYLEKIIQLPFQIPPVEQTDMSDFVHGLSAEWPHEECPRIFSEGLGDNPRQIKRTVNVFLMLWKLADRRKVKLEERVKPIRLAKLVAIQAVYPDLYNFLLKDEPRYLRELEEYYRNDSNYKAESDGEGGIRPRPAPPSALAPFLSRRDIAAVRRILLLHEPEMQNANFTGLPPDELRLYFTLTRRAEAPQVSLEEAERRLLESELGLSKNVQRALLPQTTPVIPGVDIAVLSRPADVIGGDYYDFFRFRDESHGLVVADVSGHGVSAGLLMSSLQTAVRTLGPDSDSPAEMLERINRFYIHNVNFTSFVTVFLARFDPSTLELIYVNAGHNPPLMYQKEKKETERLVPTAPAIGLMETFRPRNESITLSKGDWLLLYTDGATEAMNLKGDYFGEKRLAEIVMENSSVSAQELVLSLDKAISNYSATKASNDDITLVALKIR